MDISDGEKLESELKAQERFLENFRMHPPSLTKEDVKNLLDDPDFLDFLDEVLERDKFPDWRETAFKLLVNRGEPAKSSIK